ncbi:hypothetical protein V2J09_004192 [Rumex salicifolius]
MGVSMSRSFPAEKRSRPFLQPPPRATTTTSFFPPPPPLRPAQATTMTLSANRIVVDFTATWCGPCKMIEPTFNELASKFSDVDFVKIDVDELMEVSMEYGVQVLPTFLMMKKGQVVDRLVGVNKEELHKKIEFNRRLNNNN